MAANDDQERRILKDLREYFQGEFSGDLAKAVQGLPSEAKKFHEQTQKQLSSIAADMAELRKIAGGLDRAAQIMAKNNDGIIDAVDRLNETVASHGQRGGGNGGGSGAPPVGAGSPGPPGKAPSPTGTTDDPLWVSLTESTIKDLSEAIQRELTTIVNPSHFGGGGTGAGAGASPAGAKGPSSIPEALRQSKFDSDIADVSGVQGIADLFYQRWDNKTGIKVSDNFFQRINKSSETFITQTLARVIVGAIEYASDVTSGKRALDKIKFYAEKSFGATTKQFTSFSDSVVNDFSYIFGQTGILAEHAIQLMEDLNQQGSMAFAFQEGDAMKFGADIRKMRLTMEDTRDGQDSLFKYFSHNEQNAMLGGVYEQLVSAGFTTNLTDAKLIEATRAQYEVMQSISHSTGKSLDELILANKKNPELKEVMARLNSEGWDVKKLAQFRGLYEELGMFDPAAQQKLLNVGLDTATGGLRAFKDSPTDWGSGHAQAILDAFGKIKSGTDQTTQGLVRGIGDNTDASLAGRVDGWTGMAITNEMRAIKDKEGPNKWIEENFNHFMAALDNSRAKPFLDLASGMWGVVGSTQALIVALSMNTLAQIGLGKGLAGTIGDFFGGKGKGAGMSFGKGIWKPIITGFAKLATVLGAGVLGVIDIWNSFMGKERREAFRGEFEHAGAQADKDIRERTAELITGLLTVGVGVAAMRDPRVALLVGLGAVASMITEALTGKGILEWISIWGVRLFDQVVSFVGSVSDWFGGTFIDLFGSDAEKAAKDAWNAARDAAKTGASYVTPQTTVAAAAGVTNQLAETAASQNKISLYQGRTMSETRDTLAAIAKYSEAGANASAATAANVSDLKRPAYNNPVQI